MVEVFSVLWTVVPQIAPQPSINCRRCGAARPFRSSGKFRVNANGKQVDAWLIYKCTACDNTWNRPVLERRSVDGIDPCLLEALHRNEPALADRLACDIGDLRGGAAGASAVVAVRKEVLCEAPLSARWLSIRLAVPQPVALRLDRLLAGELGLSRNHLQALQKAGRLVTAPDGPRMLRRPLRDGTCVTLDLARECDGATICAAAGALRSTCNIFGRR